MPTKRIYSVEKKGLAAAGRTFRFFSAKYARPRRFVPPNKARLKKYWS